MHACLEECTLQSCTVASSALCRSEEPGGGTLVTYPRTIEGLARKQDSKRRRQREARAEREAARARERTAELKRLKNLKAQEVQSACAPRRMPLPDHAARSTSEQDAACWIEPVARGHCMMTTIKS
jgi:hypothetical protein